MKNFSRFRGVLPKIRHCTSKKKSLRSILITLFVFTLFFPCRTQAQDNAISLNFKNASLEVVFKSITSQSGYTFLFNNDVNTTQKVTISYNGKNLGDAMNAVLSKTNIDFKVQGKRIVLFTKKTNQKESKSKVQVKVLDSKGEPLPGATVIVDGIRGGTTTNISGMALLFFEDGSPKTIKVSFIGMMPGTLNWNGESELVVKLQEDSKCINEVVITGFGSISKERLTGSVTTINSHDLQKRVNLSLSSSLEGKVAGLSTYKGSVVIRGKSTIQGAAYPLVVVDGLPIEGTLETINPNDVESINVLKDAASASIYGTRAANGIIVVTTKSGKAGQTETDFTYDYSFTPKTRISDFRLASTAEIVDYEKYYIEHTPAYITNPLKYFKSYDSRDYKFDAVEYIYYDAAKGLITPQQKEEKLQLLKKNDYRKEYERLIWRNSQTSQYNLAVRKGTDKMDVSFSVSYQKVLNSSINNDTKSVTLNFKNGVKISSWFDVNFGVYGMFSKSYDGLGENSYNSYMPYERILDENGNRNHFLTINKNLNSYLAAIPGLYDMSYNPLDEMEQSYQKDDNSSFRTFSNINIKLAKGLKYEFKFQYQRDNTDSRSTYLKSSLYMRDCINRYSTRDANGDVRFVIPDNGLLQTNTANNYNYTVRNQLSYQTMLLKDFSFDIFCGTEFREYNNQSISSEYYGYDPDVNLKGKLVNWDELRTGINGNLDRGMSVSFSPVCGTSYLLNRDFSMYSNASLSYNRKYTIAGSWRVDQANLFGVDPKYKYRPLWSFSGSWNATEESFLKSASWLNLLKLRMSLGVSGNVDRTTSPYMLAERGYDDDLKTNYHEITSPPNPTLRWEKTQIFNAGVDFRLVDKIDGTLEFYNKYTTDLITMSDLDPSSGFATAPVNSGKMLNRGFEVSLGYNWISNKDWDVNTSFVFSYNHNEIKSINKKANTALNLAQSPYSYFRVGDPYRSLYAYRYAGITETGDPSVYDKDGNVVVNSNPMKDPNAMVYMGSLDPKFSGSFGQSVRFRNFTLDANFVYYGGHKLRLDVVPLLGKASASLPAGISERWTEDNKTSQIPRFPVFDSQGDRYYFWKYADRNVVSSTMIKLRSLGLSYRLSSVSLARLKLQGISLKAQVNNLWYWSACGHDIDPENYNALAGARSGANRPSFSFSANLTF